MHSKQLLFAAAATSVVVVGRRRGCMYLLFALFLLLVVLVTISSIVGRTSVVNGVCSLMNTTVRLVFGVGLQFTQRLCVFSSFLFCFVKRDFIAMNEAFVVLQRGV